MVSKGIHLIYLETVFQIALLHPAPLRLCVPQYTAMQEIEHYMVDHYTTLL
jgi:hypothetical protein